MWIEQPVYCRECGSALTTYLRKQFDRLTGKGTETVYAAICPKWIPPQPSRFVDPQPVYSEHDVWGTSFIGTWDVLSERSAAEFVHYVQSREGVPAP